MSPEDHAHRVAQCRLAIKAGKDPAYRSAAERGETWSGALTIARDEGFYGSSRSGPNGGAFRANRRRARRRLGAHTYRQTMRAIQNAYERQARDSGG